VEVESPDPFEHDGETIYPIRRTFIAASRHNNPHFGEDYERKLQNLREPLRSMVLYGTFNLKHMDDPWQVIPTSWVLEAQERWREQERPHVLARTYGIDVARGGADYTYIAKLYQQYMELVGYPGEETPDGPTVIEKIKQETHLDTLHYWESVDDKTPMNITLPRFFVDSIGVGASVYDFGMQENWNIEGFNAAEGSDGVDQTGQHKFVNKRAEAYWRMREALDPTNETGLALPDDRELRVDLCAPRFTMKPRGIQIEPKEDIKKRIGRSPDKGDAVVICWYGASRLPLRIW
jgi:hypothetical protein